MVPGTDPIGTLLGIEQIDEPGPQLLIVDQFEEIAASGAADAFATRVLDLVLDAALDVHVVVVVRADQYGTLALSRHLVELIEDAQVLVGPPSEDELRRIATQPAMRTGCTVEPELVELLVADVAGQDGTLPLASAALAEVWERRRSATSSPPSSTSRSADSPRPSSGSANGHSTTRRTTPYATSCSVSSMSPTTGSVYAAASPPLTSLPSLHQLSTHW